MFVLFLDHDGVLHPTSQRRLNRETRRIELGPQAFCHLPRFESLMREPPFRHLKLVVATNWRYYMPWPEIISPFSDDILARIIGPLPMLRIEGGGGYRTPYRRQEEIDAWLDQNPEYQQHWVGIDDWRPYFPPEAPRVFFCDSEVGLDDPAKQSFREFLLSYT